MFTIVCHPFGGCCLCCCLGQPHGGAGAVNVAVWAQLLAGALGGPSGLHLL